MGTTTKTWATGVWLVTLTSLAGAQFTSQARVSGDPQASSQANAGSNLYLHDDGASENSLGLTNGGEIVWLQRFDTNTFGLSSDTLNTIGFLVGDSNDLAASEFSLYVWDDPDDDGDPTTGPLVLIEESTAFVDAADENEIRFVNLPSPATVNDVFFVGLSVNQEAGQFPAPYDSNVNSLDRAWVTGNNLPDGFDPTDLNGPGSIGVFELDDIGFSGVWVLRTGDVGVSTRVYCTAKTSSCGLLPSIGSGGVPSASASNGFTIFAGNARWSQLGLILYSDAGPAVPAIPFQGGLLCVNPQPLARTVTTIGERGGFPNPCLATLSLDMNAFASGALGGSPLPSLSIPGTQVNAQFWGRDDVTIGSLLSNAIEYTIEP